MRKRKASKEEGAAVQVATPPDAAPTMAAGHVDGDANAGYVEDHEADSSVLPGAIRDVTVERGSDAAKKPARTVKHKGVLQVCSLACTHTIRYVLMLTACFFALSPPMAGSPQ